MVIDFESPDEWPHSIQPHPVMLLQLKIDVISCHEVAPRRRGRNDLEDVEKRRETRRAFRLCVKQEDCERLLVADEWPHDESSTGRLSGSSVTTVAAADGRCAQSATSCDVAATVVDESVLMNSSSETTIVMPLPTDQQ